jgi:ABC-type transporter Mla MlaB component
MYKLQLESSALALSGRVTRDDVPAFLIEARDILKGKQPRALDLSGLEYLDSAGVAGLEELILELKARVPELKIIPSTPEVEQVRQTFKTAISQLPNQFRPVPLKVWENLSCKGLLALKRGLCSAVNWPGGL